jgi:hypothetical protein
MFCAETREVVRETVVVGEVPQTSVQEASLPQGQHPLLRNNGSGSCRQRVVIDDGVPQGVVTPAESAAKRSHRHQVCHRSLSSGCEIIVSFIEVWNLICIVQCEIHLKYTELDWKVSGQSVSGFSLRVPVGKWCCWYKILKCTVTVTSFYP